MSQNNNNEISSAAIVFAFVGAMAMMLIAFIYLLFAFIALVATVLCLFAWNSPLHLGSTIITPEEARRFVYGGLIGAGLLPAFCVFGAIMFDIRIEDAWVPHILVAGYTLGSVGWQYLEAQANKAQGEQTIIPPDQQIVPPHSYQPPAQPFRFATWDDEDGR